MAKPAQTERPLHERCARCGHSFSFHGKQLGRECKAMGCKGGATGGRCEGFVPAGRARLSVVG